MAKLVLMVGLPGSGKTTQAITFEDQGYSRLSLDDIREELYGDPDIQGDVDQVMEIFNERLLRECASERDLVVDNTNIRKNYRDAIVTVARDHGYKDITFMFVDTALEECLRRNKLRTKVVPEDVILRMHSQLEREREQLLRDPRTVLVKGDKYEPTQLTGKGV